MTAQAIRRPAASLSPSEAAAQALCRHCGTALSGAQRQSGFCCAGCAAAFAIVRDLDLTSFYRRRTLDPDHPLPKPDIARTHEDFTAFVSEGDGIARAHFMVDGIRCAACVWLIENVLARQSDVTQARVNMTTRRLALEWRGAAERVNDLAATVTALGYRLVPYDAAALAKSSADEERALLRAMAVAGFAAANVMLLSISVWAGFTEGMGAATRELLYWFSALIALPAIAYAGRPFYRGALTALSRGRANMDVPISLAVVLAAGMSLYETATGGAYAYFDAATALLFFLLIGRYLDSRARGRARAAAERLVALGAGAATIEDAAGKRRLVHPDQLKPGMIAVVALGERIAADGRVIAGASDVDTSLLTGETVPVRAAPGSDVYAGTLNLTGGLRVEVAKAGGHTMLAEIVRLMEAAEGGRSRYVATADRLARAYVPAVHGFAAGTFAVWLFVLGASWQAATLNAIAVLIVTCPCALALAVPVVQVVASGRLFGQGILIKSPTALERLAAADLAVFDKTGTLTEGTPELIPDTAIAPETLAAAAGLAGASKHPLARALHAAAPEARAPARVEEVPGYGLGAETPQGEIRLGSRRWCGGDGGEDASLELWFTAPGERPLRFRFADKLRSDAGGVVAGLAARGIAAELLSGDRAETVRQAAAAAGIETWRGECLPAEKTRHLAALTGEGRRVLMVGDGLNDAPALAAAHVSMSPSTASDISQTAADIVFQGGRLAPVIEALDVARQSRRLVKQNFAMALLYNAVTVPLAMMGLVTPLIAAVAMSSSSLLVTGNALRLSRMRAWTSSSF